jgi:hypothetical protein
MKISKVPKAFAFLFILLPSIIFSSNTQIQKKLQLLAHTQGYGYKTANLMQLRAFLSNKKINKFSISIPTFKGISSNCIHGTLADCGLDLHKKWSTLSRKYFTKKRKHQIIHSKKFSKKFIQELTNLSKKIKKTFNAFAKKQTELNQYPESLKIMVRSSGNEDSTECANAGGNHSELNVAPKQHNILVAIGNVVASYFSPKSFQQRLNAGDKTIFDLPLTPVLIQHMVGSENNNSISTGCVVYSQEPAGLAQNITTIQSTWGHPQAIADSLLPADTTYVTNNKFIHHVTRIKRKRLVSNNHDLINMHNPKKLVTKHSLSKNAIAAIDTLTRMLVTEYGYPIDLELIIDTAKQHIFLLQARPLIQTTQAQPSYVSHIKKIPDLDKLACTTISSNNGQALKLTDKQQLITAQTLEHALEQYNQNPSQTIKVIVVKEKAEPTSHAAATLRGEGLAIVTCQEDYNDFIFWLSNKQYNIVIDVQQGKIINNEQEQANIKTGWLNYALPLSFSAMHRDVKTHYLSKSNARQIRKKLTQLKNFKHIPQGDRALLKSFEQKITLLENNFEYALSAIEQTKHLPPSNLQRHVDLKTVSILWLLYLILRIQNPFERIPVSLNY